MSEEQQLRDFTYRASAASWVFFGLAAAAFFLRTVSRIWFVDTPGKWEDIIISISWALDVVRMVTFALALAAVRQVTPENMAQTVPVATFWALFADSWAFLSVTLPKIAVALLIIRIFRPRPSLRATFLGVSIGLFVICIVGFIICFVQCNPVAGQWDPYNHPDTTCWPRNVQIDYALAASAASTVLDLLFAVYPAFVIARLQMSVSKKISTIVLMGLGLTAFAVGVVKVSQNGTLLGNPSLNDLYVHTMSIGLWNSIENDLIIIAACVPMIPALFRGKQHTSNYDSLSYGTGKKSFLKLKSGQSNQADVNEGLVELVEPVHTDRSIHVRYDYTVTRQ